MLVVEDTRICMRPSFTSCFSRSRICSRLLRRVGAVLCNCKLLLLVLLAALKAGFVAAAGSRPCGRTAADACEYVLSCDGARGATAVFGEGELGAETTCCCGCAARTGDANCCESCEERRSADGAPNSATHAFAGLDPRDAVTVAEISCLTCEVGDRSGAKASALCTDGSNALGGIRWRFCWSCGCR